MATPEIILHHYPRSPYSQKVLLALALKKIPFKSFVVEPVPGRVVTNALVGGYRRIPVLQIGADFYCDTYLILQVLEDLFPSPSLSSPSDQASIYAYKVWSDKLLFPPTIYFLPWDLVPKELKADREKALGRSFDKAAVEAVKPSLKSQLAIHFATLESTLSSDNRKFILGDSPSLADIHIYMPLFFLHNTGNGGVLKKGGFGNIPHVLAWYERITHLAGPEVVALVERGEVTKEEVFEIAVNESSKLASIPQQSSTTMVGHEVRVTPSDTFRRHTDGVVVEIDNRRVVIRRSGEWEGKRVATNVHFPRAEFDVIKKNQPKL